MMKEKKNLNQVQQPAEKSLWLAHYAGLYTCPSRCGRSPIYKGQVLKL
jgi:hypothetical protein